MLFKFGKVISPQCSFCKLHEETIMPLFYDCLIVKRIWNQLKSILSNNANFLIRTPQECHLRILGLRYKWTPYLKPLITYFQNVHLQCKNNRLLEHKSSAYIYYVLKAKGYRKEIMWEWCKKNKKIQ